MLLGDAGGWAYFILSTYVANEYFMPIEQDHRTSDDVHAPRPTPFPHS